VSAIERDCGWRHSDGLTAASVRAAALLPYALRVRLFRSLYWDLPDA
jgi:hypothetical protein